MHLLLLGSTGRTGIHVLQEALKRGHTITALVRNPSVLDSFKSAPNSNLVVLRGSPLNATDITNAIAVASGDGKAPFAIISTLNPRRTSGNPWAAAHPTDSPPRLMADSIKNALAALDKNPSTAGANPKVIHMSALGVGSSKSQAPWGMSTMVAYSNLKLGYADHEATEEELRRARGVDWVSVRPTMLLGGDEDSVVKVWPEGKGRVGWLATSPMQGVAKFLIDAAESPEWNGQAPIVIA